MRMTSVFDVAASPHEVVAYLSDPGNIVSSRRAAVVVERSGPPIRTGSWCVLAFDQLRARVEYSDFSPPDRIAISVSMSGRGSAGVRSAVVYRLAPRLDGRGTTVDLDAETSGSWLWNALNGLILRVSGTRPEAKMVADLGRIPK